MLSSPELVENEQYDKKADIWASGCILYELSVLEPPFYATNILALAKKVSITSLVTLTFNSSSNFQIAEVDFDLLPLQQYSLQVREVVCKCLVADPLKRPDSIQVHVQTLPPIQHLVYNIQIAGMIANQLMKQLDNTTSQCILLENKILKERVQTRRFVNKP